MSKTDETRPWWVRMAEAAVAVHDHRLGGVHPAAEGQAFHVVAAAGAALGTT